MTARHIDPELYKRVVCYFVRKTNINVARDLAHDALLRWCRADEHPNPEALLMRAAGCVLIDHIRSAAVRYNADLAHSAWAWGQDRNVADIIEAEDFAAYVLSKLPPKNREIIFHLKGLGFMNCEIQAKFHVSGNTVESHWRDAKLALVGIEL